MQLTFDHVLARPRRQAPYVRHAPPELSPDLSEMVGREVYLKWENLQRPARSRFAAPSRIADHDPAERARAS